MEFSLKSLKTSSDKLNFCFKNKHTSSTVELLDIFFITFGSNLGFIDNI